MLLYLSLSYIYMYIQILDNALKQFKSSVPTLPVLLLSVDRENSKVLCLAHVPEVCHYIISMYTVLRVVNYQSVVGCGLKANEWVTAVSVPIEGKGGGRDRNAQAVGSNVSNITQAVQVANSFADKYFN